MTNETNRGPGTRSTQHRSAKADELPAWTNGLKQLYEKVVDEDLPDSFKDLLARLDDDGK